jgi:transposase-like protein
VVVEAVICELVSDVGMSRLKAAVSGVARKYGISTSLLFRWRKDLEAAKSGKIIPPISK